MTLSLVANRPLLIAGVAAALAWVGFAAQPAAAQAPKVPIGSKGFQTAMHMQRHMQTQRKAAPSTVARAPSASSKQLLTVRGPRGDIRTFELEGQITRVIRSSPTSPHIVTVRGTDGRTRAFVMEGPITKVETAPR
jgi:hypothetical protein